MSGAASVHDEDKQSTRARQPWDKASKIVLSASGIFALFYAFGYLAVKAKLNMLGVWTELGIDPMGYAATMIQALPVFTIASVVVLILAVSVAYILFSITRRFGYGFVWSGTGKPPVWRSLFIIAYSVMALYWPIKLNENQDLLLKQGGIEPRDSALLVVFSEDFRAERFLLTAILFLNIIFLAFLLKRWLNRPPWPGLLHLPVALLLMGIALSSAFYLPGTYGRLVLPNNYRKAAVFMPSDKSDEKQFKGYPIIQSQQALVLFGDEPDAIKGKVVFLSWDKVARLEFSSESEFLLPRLYENSSLKPLLDERKEDSMFMKWALGLVIGLAFCMVLACAKKQQPSNSAPAAAPPEARPTQTASPAAVPVNKASALTDTTGRAQARNSSKVRVPKTPEPPPPPPQPKPPDTSANKEAAKPSAPSGFIASFFPTLKKYGDKLFTILEDMVVSSKGDEAPVPNVSRLNIWAFDTANGSFKQITRDGGYSYPRASEDGSQISFIKNGRIGVIDISGKNERMVTAQGRYTRILAWNPRTAEYLVMTGDTHVYSLKQDRMQQLSLDPATLNTLSQMSEELKLVYSSEGPEGHWKVFEDHQSYKQAKVLFEGDNIYANPSWLGIKKILFVSDRKK